MPELNTDRDPNAGPGHTGRSVEIVATKRTDYMDEMFPEDRSKEEVGEDVLDKIRDIITSAGIDPAQLAVSKERQGTKTVIDREVSDTPDSDENDGDEDDQFYESPESMYTLMVTAKSIMSLPFLFAMVVLVLSTVTLVFALMDLLADNEEGNPLAVPPGVEAIVRVSQFLAILLGWLMEEEIPTGIQMLVEISRENLGENDTSFRYWRVVFSACCRIFLGYIFLISMFVIVVQSEEVLDLFFNILALHFIESVDDVVFSVVKKGLFGRRLQRATVRCTEVQIKTRPKKSGNKCNILLWIKSIYFLNLVGLFGGFIFVTKKQIRGDFQCKTLSINFEDTVWGDAVVEGDEERVLMYSFFSGTYKLDPNEEKVKGRSVYVEQNKKDGMPYEETEPAKFKYCVDEEAWVFVHENIFRHEDEKGDRSECPWLLKSPKTKSFDLASVPITGWSLWAGSIVSGQSLTITCDECETDADCNFNGECADSKCNCKEGQFFGTHCEFKYPCESLKMDIGEDASLVVKPGGDPPFVTSYGRPIYQGEVKSIISISDGSEIEFYYRLGLAFAGSRWFGSYSVALTEIDINESFLNLYDNEFHGFWNKANDPDETDFSYFETVYISEADYGNDPIGVDFNFVEFKGGDFKPYGFLKPVHEFPGQGFFHCETDRCEGMEMGWNKYLISEFNCESDAAVVDCSASPFNEEEQLCVCDDGVDTMKSGYFCHIQEEESFIDEMTESQ